MKITPQDVSYVADLANLELTPAERERMLRDLNAVLEHIDRLNEVDTSGVEPMSQVAGSVATPLREDENLPGLPHAEALRNAPQTDGDFFLVPRVIDKSTS